MNKMHLFDIELAEKHGVHAAIILNHIVYWVNYNRNNNTNFHDNNWWVYHSIKAFNKLFPYMSEKIIRRNLKKLETSGLIITGNYNSKQYDRTKWYALDLTQCDQTSTSIYPKGTNAYTQKVQMEISQEENSIYPKGTNGFTQKVQMDLPKKDTPIPNNKTNIESNNKKTDNKKEILVSDKSKTNNKKDFENDAIDVYNLYRNIFKSGNRKLTIKHLSDIKTLDKKKVKPILKMYSKNELLQAIKNYQFEVEKNRTESKYFIAPHNFFSLTTEKFMDYMGYDAEVRENKILFFKEIDEIKNGILMTKEDRVNRLKRAKDNYIHFLSNDDIEKARKIMEAEE